jgi:hypothetical protein
MVSWKFFYGIEDGYLLQFFLRLEFLGFLRATLAHENSLNFRCCAMFRVAYVV